MLSNAQVHLNLTPYYCEARLIVQYTIVQSVANAYNGCIDVEQLTINH